MKTTSPELLSTPPVKRVDAARKRKSRLTNLRFGFKMMLDFQVPISRKLLAIGAGVAATALLLLFEIPLTGFLLTIPGIGLVLDFLIDGSEALIAPALFACMLLPRLVSSEVMARYIGDEPLEAIQE